MSVVDCQMRPRRTPRVDTGRRDELAPRLGVRGAQRARLLAAMMSVVAEHGVRGASVARVVATAGMSRRTFYLLFGNRDDCLLAAMEQTAELAARRANAAWLAEERWADRLRAGLWALLEFFEEEPNSAELCIVHSLAASRKIMARRQRVCDQLARLLEDGRSDPGVAPSTAASATVGGALAVVHARLIDSDVRPLTDLLRPLMSFIVLSRLGMGAARRELTRPSPARSTPRERDETLEPLAGLHIRLTYRTMRVLGAIAADPGLKSRQVSEMAGITDEGQTSKLLGRLARLGLIENTGAEGNRNAPKAWRLTPAGERLERSVRRELP